MVLSNILRILMIAIVLMVAFNMLGVVVKLLSPFLKVTFKILIFLLFMFVILTLLKAKQEP